MKEALIKMMLESSLVQGLLTLGMTAFTMFMLASGKPMEDNVWLLLGTAWGFYFGTKSNQQTSMLMSKYEQEHYAIDK